MTIVGTTEISETVTLTGGPGYNVTPITDTPAGLLGALTSNTFSESGHHQEAR